MEEFLKKWDDKVLSQVLSYIMQRALMAVTQEADPEDRGVVKAADMVAADLLNLPWDRVIYIIKRKL